MKKIILLLALLCLPFALRAQQSYAYFSKQEVMKSMPEYAEAQRQLATLREQYAAELGRAEAEFNTKYEEFLEGQRTFAPSIMQKRQAELRELMEKNLAFKHESDRLLRQAEGDLLAPVEQRLRDVLQRVGEDNGYAFILDTDSGACPYVNPAAAADITNIIRERVRAR